MAHEPQGEQAARDDAPYLAAVIDAVADSTFTIDREGKVLWRSDRLVRRTGVIDEEVLRRHNPVERIHPEDMPLVLEELARLSAEPGGRTRLVVRSRSVEDDDVFETIELTGTNAFDDDVVQGIVVQVRNLDEGRRVADLGRGDGELRSLADAVPLGIILSDPRGRLVYRNAAARAILGDDLRSLDTDEWLDLVRPASRDELVALLGRARRGEGGGEVTVAISDAAGPVPGGARIGWVRIRVAPHLADDGTPAGVIATIEDMTEQVEARAETERLTAMLDASSDFVVVWRQDTGDVLWANAVTRAMLDVPLRSGGTRRLSHLLDEESGRRVIAAREALDTSDVWEGELTLLHPRRGEVPVSTIAVVQRDDDGAIDTVALVARDITELKAAEGRLRHLANHDPLTGLPNRSLLHQHLTDAILRHRRSDGGLAVLFCDLDGFKDVNDRYGHSAGDVVLTEVARRLEAATRETDLLARVGGDEFVVLCEGVSHAALEDVALRLVAAVEPPILVEGETVSLGASVGAAYAAAGYDPDPDRLLLVADRAMYEAKESGRARFTIHPLAPPG